MSKREDKRPLGVRMRAVAKAERRKASAKARRDGKGLEGVITTVTTQLQAVTDRPIDMQKLYDRAAHDMGLRIRLGNAARSGDVGAGKRRRQLNDWELNTKPAGPGAEGWLPEQTRRAVGKCDVDAVQSLNKQKRGY